MIFVRSPLRISLGGGGTDFPSYYKIKSGFLISAAIDKYVYVTIMEPFSKGIFLKYSNLENVSKISDIQHKIIKQTLKFFMPKVNKIEITTLADIPSGTGLGSSGSFTAALILAIFAHKGHFIDKQELAELACEIEIEKLKQPIGKQDQFVTSFGGINSYHFYKNDKVKVEPLNISNETIYELEDNLLLFFTGYSRQAVKILKDQDTKTKLSDKEMIKNLDFIKDLGIQSKDFLEKGDLKSFGELMHEHWLYKKNRTQNISNFKINELYNLGYKNGALGGKLVGAGGGGFLMFYAKDKFKLRTVMKNAGLEEVRFKFDYDGTKTVLRS